MGRKGFCSHRWLFIFLCSIFYWHFIFWTLCTSWCYHWNSQSPQALQGTCKVTFLWSHGITAEVLRLQTLPYFSLLQAHPGWACFRFAKLAALGKAFCVRTLPPSGTYCSRRERCGTNSLQIAGVSGSQTSSHGFWVKSGEKALLVLYPGMAASGCSLLADSGVSLGHYEPQHRFSALLLFPNWLSVPQRALPKPSVPSAADINLCLSRDLEGLAQ